MARSPFAAAPACGTGYHRAPACKAPRSGRAADAGPACCAMSRGCRRPLRSYHGQDRLLPLPAVALRLSRRAAARGDRRARRARRSPTSRSSSSRIFEAIGTPAVKDRHPSRQAYRLHDIARVAADRGAADQPPAARSGRPTRCRPRRRSSPPRRPAAAISAGWSTASSRAVWAEDRDIADDAVVRDVLNAHGFDPALADKGLLAAMETLERNTDEALRRGVFGAPTYVVGDELFWGQDRLPHLDAASRRAAADARRARSTARLAWREAGPAPPRCCSTARSPIPAPCAG